MPRKHFGEWLWGMNGEFSRFEAEYTHRNVNESEKSISLENWKQYTFPSTVEQINEHQ